MLLRLCTHYLQDGYWWEKLVLPHASIHVLTKTVIHRTHFNHTLAISYGHCFLWSPSSEGNIFSQAPWGWEEWPCYCPLLLPGLYSSLFPSSIEVQAGGEHTHCTLSAVFTPVTSPLYFYSVNLVPIVVTSTSPMQSVQYPSSSVPDQRSSVLPSPQLPTTKARA